LAIDVTNGRARNELENYLRERPEDPAALVRLAAVQQRAGDEDQAIKTYERVVADYPHFAPATRGLVLLSAERASDIQKTYDLAVKARAAYPDDPEVAKAFGILSYRQKFYARALEVLNEAAIKKDDAELLYFVGATYRQLKQWTRCREALGRAWSLKLPPRLREEARQTLADCSDPPSQDSP
jgi:tetratricopeptide (TPR) repeat protein